jgi:hypothetical protein
MKIIISKDQYRRVLLKFLDSFIKGFDVDPYEEESSYRNVKTSDGDDFATLWHDEPITKGCKRELSLDNQFTNDFESFIPINRKKVFSEVVLEYFTSKTGIKCDCVEFSYFTGKYKELERYDDDSDEVISYTDKEFDHYHYKKPKRSKKR